MVQDAERRKWRVQPADIPRGKQIGLTKWLR
jgi:hypothetical protein